MNRGEQKNRIIIRKIPAVWLGIFQNLALLYYSIMQLHSIQKDTQQDIYIQNEYDFAPNRMTRVEKIARELGVMHPLCQISVCIPAYREA